MKNALILALAVLPLFATAQDTKTPAQKTQPVTVSVAGKGSDVRGILADLFGQAKQNFVLQPGISFALYLALDKVEFEEALNIICNQAKLQFEVQNGIYFISKAKAVVIAAATPPVASKVLDKSVLTRKLTTKLEKAEIRAVFAEFAKQTKVAIDVDKSVPNFKLDARLTKITLKGALDKVTEATGLKYKFTDTFSILIYKPDDENKVSVSGS